MITVVIILALLTLIVATDPIPGEGNPSAVEFDDDSAANRGLERDDISISPETLAPQSQLVNRPTPCTGRH